MIISRGGAKNGNRILDNRGVALLLAVSVISLLIAVTVQFSKDMRQNLIGSAMTLDTSRLNMIVFSGYNIAVAVLQQDLEDGKYDTFFDRWAELESGDLDEFYGDGLLDVDITDLSGRIPLNALEDGSKTKDATQTVLKRLLLSGDLGEIDEDTADLIVASITDWIDGDDESSSEFENTESSYYKSLDPAYSCKNGTMAFVEELLLLRGITSDLFYGTDESVGLRDLVTVQGGAGSKININTAPKVVLKAMIDDSSDSISDEFRDELADKMVTFRSNEENVEALESTSWYETAFAEVTERDISLQSGFYSTASSYFSIESRGEVSEMSKKLTAVVEREDSGEIVLVSRKFE